MQRDENVKWKTEYMRPASKPSVAKAYSYIEKGIAKETICVLCKCIVDLYEPRESGNNKAQVLHPKSLSRAARQCYTCHSQCKCQRKRKKKTADGISVFERKIFGINRRAPITVISNPPRFRYDIWIAAGWKSPLPLAPRVLATNYNNQENFYNNSCETLPACQSSIKCFQNFCSRRKFHHFSHKQV